jgi:DNA-nicking Smr family endonuclease
MILKIMPDDFLSDEDKALFRKMVGPIKQLSKNKKVVELASTPVKHSFVPLHTKPVQEFNVTHLSDHYHNQVQANSILSYCSHGIPVKRIRQLKSGQIPRESTLDLHGLRPETAKVKLSQFIFEQSQLGHRCLLIIHGKGGHQGKAPVLKNLVNHWLRQFPSVLAFCSALAQDGGSGALYILLKRQRISI